MVFQHQSVSRTERARVERELANANASLLEKEEMLVQLKSKLEDSGRRMQDQMERHAISMKGESLPPLPCQLYVCVTRYLV